MLTLAKLDTGTVDYYLGHAHDGTSYYTGAGEPPGRWAGAGAANLGLTPGDLVAPDDLRQLWEARGPDGTPLLSEHQTSGRTVPAYDLTASAPKSLSVLWALADDTTRRGIEGAHEAAVAAFIAYLDEHAARGRQGAQGAQQVRGSLLAATFQHRTSRAGDPQLHTHVVVPNLIRRPDGTWGTLDARELYIHYRTAGDVYRAALREHTRELGLRWDPVDAQGLSEVVGVPRDLMDRWSTRRREILDEVAAHGGDVADHNHRQQANLATRQGKSEDHAVTDEELRERWAAEAAELGHSYEGIQAGTLDPLAETKTLADRLRELREMDVLDALTAHATTFRRQDLIRELARRGVPVAELEQKAEQLLAAAVALSPDDDRDADLTTPSGARSAPGTYTTHAIRAAEQRVLGRATDGAASGAATIEPRHLETTLDAFDTLADEQAEMVRHLATSGNSIDLVSAAAGSGKTYTLSAYRHALEQQGITVVGCSTAAKAAAGLQADAGIPSDTIAKLLLELEHGRATLDPGSVVVVDEAGMVGTLDLERLAKHVHEADGKLVLVGDAHQLQAVSAGGLFRQLQDEHPETVVELTENRRQRDEREQKLAKQLRNGDIDAAAAGYVEMGRVTVGGDRTATAAALMDAYWNAHDDPTVPAVLAMAYRRADVDLLNTLAWNEAERRGHLTGETVTVTGTVDENGYAVERDTTWRAGARIVLTQNDRGLGVRNGDAGVLQGFGSHSSAWDLTVRRQDGSTYTRRSKYPAEPGQEVRYGKGGRHVGTAMACEPVGPQEPAAVVKLDDGREARIPMDYLAEHAVYGWAITTHKAQGMTVDEALLLGDGLHGRDALYVGMSRGKASNRLFVTGDLELTPDELTRHVRGLATGDVELTADEVGTQLHDATLDELAQRRRQLADLLTNVALTDDRQARARTQFDKVTARQDQLLAARLTAARFDPPAYLPDRPTSPLHRRVWTEALVAVETYRGRWGVSAPDSALGPDATNLVQAGERTQVQALLDALTPTAGHAHTSEEPATPDRDLRPVAQGLDL